MTTYSNAYLNFVSDDNSEHRWLAEISYYDTVNLTTGTLYFSTSAFGTSPSNSPASQLYDPRLLNGYNFSAMSGDIGLIGGLLPAREGGSISLAQYLGDLDILRLYSFDGRSIVIKHGGYSPMYGELDYSNYATVFNGEIEGQALVGIDIVTLKLRNKDSRFEFPIQDRLYTGGRWQLYFDGANYINCAHTGDTVDHATVGINFSTTPFTVEFFLYCESIPGSDQAIFSKGTLNTDGWVIKILSTTGKLSFATNQSGVNQVTTSDAFPLNQRVHVAIVRNGASATWYFDGVESNDSAGTHTNPTASATAMRIGCNSSGAQFFVGFIDEIRIWASARTTEQIATYRMRQLEDSECIAPLRWYSRVEDGTGTELSEEITPGEPGTIDSEPCWYPSLQGGDDLQGVPLPDVFGQRIGFAPVLCDETHLIYQAHSGSIYEMTKVFVGGATIDQDTGATPDTYSSLYLFLINVTEAGKYDMLVTQKGSWFRLGSAPNKPVTLKIKGDNTGGTGYGDASTYRSTAGDIVRYIICNRGPQPLSDSGDLNTASFSALNSANSTPVGDACYDEKTISEVVGFVLQSIGAVGWFLRDTGDFAVAVFSATDTEVSPALSLTEKDIEQDTLEVIDVGPPIWGVDLNYRKNDIVHSTTDIVGSVIGNADPSTADVNWRFLMSEWRTVRARTSTVREKFKGATILQVDTGIQAVGNAVAEGQRLLNLYSSQGQCIRAFFNQNAVQLDRMDIVEFHFQDEGVFGEMQSRLGTTSTSTFVVIAIEDDVENGGTWLTLYREAIS